MSGIKNKAGMQTRKVKRKEASSSWAVKNGSWAEVMWTGFVKLIGVASASIC